MADQTPVKANLTSGNATSLAQYATGDTIPVANGGLGSTGITGIVKGSGTAYSAATAGTDYAAATTGTNAQLLANNGSGGFSNVTVGSGLNLTTGTLTAPSSMTYPGAGIANSTGSAWGTSYTTSGSGTVVALATSPSFTTPTLGVATATTVNKVTLTAPATGSTLTIADGKTLTASNTLTFTGTDASSVAFGAGGTVFYTSGLGTNVSTFLATPTSANLAAALTDETGTGANVFATSPTLVTPILGTPQSGTLTSCTGLPISTGVSGLGTNVATFLATPSSANLASALTDETGSGLAVFNVNPTFTNYTETAYTANSSTAITLSLANGTMQYITLTGSPTITMPTAAAGKSFTLILYTGSGSYTVSWSTVAWAGGTTPTVTTTLSKKDIFNFYSDGTLWYGSIFGQSF